MVGGVEKAGSRRRRYPTAQPPLAGVLLREFLRLRRLVIFRAPTPLRIYAVGPLSRLSTPLVRGPNPRVFVDIIEGRDEWVPVVLEIGSTWAGVTLDQRRIEG